jgi:hypothetical protein
MTPFVSKWGTWSSESSTRVGGVADKTDNTPSTPSSLADKDVKKVGGVTDKTDATPPEHCVQFLKLFLERASALSCESDKTIQGVVDKTDTTPCALCGGSERWYDGGVLRCPHCWPEALTRPAREAEEREHALCMHEVEHGSYRPKVKPRDPRLGPILPFCGCGDTRYWHDHITERYQCWTCVPPLVRTQPQQDAA